MSPHGSDAMNCERCGSTESVETIAVGDNTKQLCEVCRSDWIEEIEHDFVCFCREIKACYFCGREYGERGDKTKARPSTVGGRGCVDCHNDGRG